MFVALFQHVEELARNTADVCRLRLYVEHHNHAAQQTYTRLGLGNSGYGIMELEFRRPKGDA